MGKTFLAHALGHIACRKGKSVLAVGADKVFKTLKGLSAKRLPLSAGLTIIHPRGGLTIMHRRLDSPPFILGWTHHRAFSASDSLSWARQVTASAGLGK